MLSWIDHFRTHPYGFPFFAFATLVVRYLVISGGMYVGAWIVFRGRLAHRKIQGNERPLKIRQEILWSISSFAIMALQAWGIFLLFINGQTRIYLDWREHSLLWAGASFFLLFLIHDFYFYWMHRSLHHPWLFKHVHRVHHYSKNPTPFAAFAFHPLEAVAEMAFLIPVLILIPVHAGVLFLFLILSHLFNVFGHLGYEIFPRGTWDAWWGRWVTTTVHHNLHHQYMKGNYALYFRFWDQRGGTLHPKTEAAFKDLIG